MVNIIFLIAFVVVAFTAGYFGYSRYLANQLVELDDENDTPAHKYNDGQEYVPSKKPVLLGHHYSSIAGGAPIAGPITAVAAFGWLPAVLWVGIGNPIFGSVHDFMALTASIRHEGKSIGYVVGQYVGRRGKKMLLWFAFLLIVLVISAFAFLIGTVMDAYPAAATSSIIYIALAILFGVYLYQGGLPFLPGAALFTAAVFGGIWAGLQYPIALVGTAEQFPEGTIILLGDLGAAEALPLAQSANPNMAAWTLLTIIYAFLAAVLPVWVLLQPRDFLTSTLLYSGVGTMLLGAIVGAVVGFSDVTINLSYAGIEEVKVTSMTTQVDAFLGLWDSQLGPIFPFLFVTIACGTISGFHSLVSSGTTAKQLDNETDARLIGYGGMIGEGLLALTAILAVSLVAATAGSIGNAIVTFPAGGGALLTALGVPVEAAVVFIALVFLSFLLTSTDTAMRLGRYLIEELVGTPETDVQKRLRNRYVNALLPATGGYILVASGTWANIWPLFGGANQLLAALALLVTTIWLANTSDSKQLLTTGIPLVFMYSVTIIALLWIGLYRNPLDLMQGNYSGTFAAVALVLQSVIALTLVGLALALLRMGYTSIKDARADVGTPVAAADGGTTQSDDDDDRLQPDGGTVPSDSDELITDDGPPF